MKKTTTFLFTLLCFAAGVFAQEFESGGIQYLITDNTTYTVEVISNTAGYSGSVVIPASVTNDSQEYTVTSIGTDAFRNSSALTEVTIPNSVITIGTAAFRSCSGLTSVVIPNSVTTIGVGAFRSCTNLTSVTLSENLTVLSEAVFRSCANLPSITIPNGVTTIGTGAFRSCTSLGSITIPDGVQTIDENAFRSCSALAFATIPSSVLTIGLNAFYGCTSLISIEVDAANTQYASTDGTLYTKDQTTLIQFPTGQSGNFTIPNTVTTIGESAFLGSERLTGVTMPNSLETIEYAAFSFCTGLSSVTFPNSVTTVGSYVFFECTGLTSVTIGSSMGTIGEEAFSGCTNLATITSLNTTPPTLDANAFLGVDKTVCGLFVPENSVDTYKAALQWQDFSTISAIAESSVATASIGTTTVYAQHGTLYVTDAIQPYTVHNIAGAQVYTGTAPSITLPQGTYVVTVGNERQKVMVQ